ACTRVSRVCVVTAAALRGVAIQRGRVGAARATFPTSAAALALARNPGQLAAAAAATALHPFAPAVYYDPFFAAHAATQDSNYRLQVRHFSISTNSREQLFLASGARDRRESCGYRDTKYSNEFLIKSKNARG
ncbi:hypothetical protein G5I_10534, partial [Acromyrmex echinatior]